MLWNTEATAWTLPSSPFNVHKLTCHKHLTHQQADGWEDGSVFLDGLKTNNPGINSHVAASVITVLKSKVSFLNLTYFMYITSPGSRIKCQQLTSQQSTDTSTVDICTKRLISHLHCMIISRRPHREVEGTAVQVTAVEIFLDTWGLFQMFLWCYFEETSKHFHLFSVAMKNQLFFTGRVRSSPSMIVETKTDILIQTRCFFPTLTNEVCA